jgi:radical SAM-linked protein
MREPQISLAIAHHESHNPDNKLDKFTKRSMRIQITFSKTGAMRFTGHLDLHRAWERTFRRAALPLAYSQGYNPRPKMNLASALPLGFTSECEVIDVRLES